MVCLLTWDRNVADGTMESRAPRVGHKKSRKGCAQCKRRHVKVGCFVLLLVEVALRNDVADRFRSAMKRNRAPIAPGMESRALLLEDPMYQEKMQRIDGRRRLRRRQRVSRERHRKRHQSVVQRRAPARVEA